jgi:hypothetical protein
VQLGGLRMDVGDRKEMEAWRQYVEPVAQARKAHYRLLIKETLHDASLPHVCVLVYVRA